MENNHFTFKQLLSKYKVEIPVLQRDYVQGSPKNKKAKIIRQNFSYDLVNHLKCENSDEMTLDFIYGKIIDDELAEENERQMEHLDSLLDTVNEYALKNGFKISKSIKIIDESISKDTFIPFDGQQRLTTLFILHFLIYAHLNKNIDFLNNFKYKTRESTRDFLSALIDNKKDFENVDWQSSFQELIMDSNWFFDIWKYDPTVISILVMMDKFRETIIIAENQEIPRIPDIYKNIFNNLEKENVLSFDFLDIEEHDLDDSLYIKMNASGKDLSEFEKFKSWLIEYIEEEKIEIEKEDWEEKLDSVWYDIFWEANQVETDKNLYYFFRYCLLLKFCSQNLPIIDQNSRDKNLKEKKEVYGILKGEDEVSFNFLKDKKLITSANLNFIFRNLDFLSGENYHSYQSKLRNSWKEPFISEWQVDEEFKHFITLNIANLNLFHLTMVFSIFNFIDSENELLDIGDSERFSEWVRLSRNLIYNSRIDDDAPFFNAIQSLATFGDKCLNITEKVKTDAFIDYFPERQRKEEYRKREIIFNEWQNNFIEAENQEYFYGQIGFLITLSENEKNEPNLEKFKALYSSLSKIFSNENLDGEFLIARSFLTINDDWLPSYGSDRYLFCLSKRANARERNENWRIIFNDEVKMKYLLILVEKYDEFGSLEEIIEEGKSNITDWRYLLLKYPKELKYCKQGLINYLKEGKYIRLLGQSRLSHYHRELRTSILFNYFLKESYNLKDDNYGELKSDGNCFIKFNVNDEKIKIIFDYNLLKFNVYQIINHDTEDGIEELLESEQIKSIDDKLFEILSFNEGMVNNLPLEL